MYLTLFYAMFFIFAEIEKKQFLKLLGFQRNPYSKQEQYLKFNWLPVGKRTLKHFAKLNLVAVTQLCFTILCYIC